MARKLNTAPEWANGLGRPRKYPWDQWLDGSYWEIVRGEDFVCQLDSMTAAIHSAAKQRGLSVTTNTNPDNTSIVFRSFRKVASA